MTHTPGPWSFMPMQRGRRLGARIAAGDGDNLEIIAEVYKVANGGPLAAAPELLAALRSLLPGVICDHDNGGGIFSTVQLDKARAAIAKAEGVTR